MCNAKERYFYKVYKKAHPRLRIHQTIENDVCRACKQNKETMQHVISGCPVLARTKYFEKQDNVCEYIHICLIKRNISSWKMFQSGAVTTPNHSSKMTQPRSCGTYQDKLTDALIMTNPISSYWRKTPEPSQSLVLQSLMTRTFLEKTNDKVTNTTNLAIELKQLKQFCENCPHYKLEGVA